MLHVVGTIGLAARFVLALILHIDLLEVALASASCYLFFICFAVFLLPCQYLISILEIPLMISLAPLGTHTLLQLQSATQLDGTR